MGRVITKNRDPRVNEFGPDDFVLNTKTGDLFAKANNKLFKITSRDQTKNSSNEDVLNNITVDNINTLKGGKAITNTTQSIDTGVVNNWITPEAIISTTDNSTYQKFTIPGRVGQFISGTLFFDQNLSGSNNYITMGDGDTNITLSGSVEASIIQQSTITSPLNIGQINSDPTYAVYTGMGEDIHIKISDGTNVRVGDTSRLSIQPPQPSIKADVANNIINFKDLDKGEIDVSSYEIKNPILISSNIDIPTNQIAVLENGTNKTIKIAADSSIKINTGAQLFANFIKNIPSIDTNTKTTLTSNIISTGIIEGKLDGGSF